MLNLLGIAIGVGRKTSTPMGSPGPSLRTTAVDSPYEGRKKRKNSKPRFLNVLHVVKSFVQFGGFPSPTCSWTLQLLTFEMLITSECTRSCGICIEDITRRAFVWQKLICRHCGIWHNRFHHREWPQDINEELETTGPLLHCCQRALFLFLSYFLIWIWHRIWAWECPIPTLIWEIQRTGLQSRSSPALLIRESDDIRSCNQKYASPANFLFHAAKPRANRV